MGNSFGYFSNKQDDEKVLTAVGKILRPSGQLVLDITDGGHMHEHFEQRSWEWIDEHHFVCRERSHQPGRRAPDLARGDRARRDGRDRRPVLRRAPLHARKHQPSCWSKTGFRNVRHHGHAEALSDRDQDLGMMARRILLSADAPAAAGAQGQGQDAGASTSPS